MFNGVQVTSPKLIRKRSSSLDTKAGLKYRENNIGQSQNQEKQMKKYASSGNLFNPDSVNASRPKNKTNTNCDGYFLFINWFKDFKSVKPLLSLLQDLNIFKTDFPRQNNINLKINSPMVFLIINNLKIDNEYEAYCVNDYSERLKELMNWTENERKELYDEYVHGLELIDKQIVDDAADEIEKQFVEGKLNQRRSSETMALIIQNKNQPMQTFLPREYQGQMTVIRYTCEFEVYYLSQDKKNERNYKSVTRTGIVSNQDINIFTKNFKLKDSYTLKHIYLGQCSDTQIANIDSCLRIGGPFGNDIIIRFQTPLIRNEWYNYINDEIIAYQETIKNCTSIITIFNDTNPASSIPLVSKSITINGTTTGFSLKKMAMNIFEIKDIDIKDLSIVFLLKSKENILHDDVSLMVLQEHVNNVQENSCVKSCLYCDKGIVIVKIIYYLRSNRPLNDSLIKGIGQSKKPVFIKPKQNKYNINTRWNENEMPKWLMNLLADLYNEGAKCEGIFRVSGSVIQSDEYINQISETDDLKIDTTIHNKANILKKFISIIDGSLLTTITKENFYSLSNEIISVDDFLLQDELQTKLLEFIQKIPANHLNLFQHIVVILDHIIKNSQINQMNIINLSTCFSQNLFKHLSDDAVTINKLFECILYLKNRIVNPVTYNNIVRSYEKKKLSVGSGESHPKSDGIINFDIESNSPTTSRTVSDSNDERRSSTDKPIVPPRHRKVNTRMVLNTPEYSPDITIRPIKKKISLNDKRQSLSVDLPTNKNNKQLDEVDSKFNTSNILDEPILPSKSVTNLTTKSKKLSRNSNTFNASSPDNSRSESSNFYRQIQVNRKHKNNSNMENTNQTPNNAKYNVSQLKTGAKLTRSTDRVIPKSRSRSQSKLPENVPNITLKSSKTTYLYNADSSLEFENSKNESTERKRSNSAHRVPKLKEQYESNLVKPNPPLPPKKQSIILDNQNPKVSKIVKDIEESKIIRSNERPKNNITRKPHGPVRPLHNFQSNNAQEERKQITLSHSSNSLSLHDTLNDSNDDNDTFI